MQSALARRWGVGLSLLARKLSRGSISICFLEKLIQMTGDEQPLQIYHSAFHGHKDIDTV